MMMVMMMVMVMMMTGEPSNKCYKNFLQVRQPKLLNLFQRKFAWNIYTKFR